MKGSASLFVSQCTRSANARSASVHQTSRHNQLFPRQLPYMGKTRAGPTVPWPWIGAAVSGGIVTQSGSKYRTSGFAERPPLRRSRRGKPVGGGTEISTSTRSLIGYFRTSVGRRAMSVVDTDHPVRRDIRRPSWRPSCRAERRLLARCMSAPWPPSVTASAKSPPSCPLQRRLLAGPSRSYCGNPGGRVLYASSVSASSSACFAYGAARSRPAR